MPHYIDLAAGRGARFLSFSPFDKPYFNVCTQLGCHQLLHNCRKRPGSNSGLRTTILTPGPRTRSSRSVIACARAKSGLTGSMGHTFIFRTKCLRCIYFDYAESFSNSWKARRKPLRQSKAADWALPPPSRGRRPPTCTTLPWSLTVFHTLRRGGREYSVRRISFASSSRTTHSHCCHSPSGSIITNGRLARLARYIARIERCSHSRKPSSTTYHAQIFTYLLLLRFLRVSIAVWFCG